MSGWKYTVQIDGSDEDQTDWRPLASAENLEQDASPIEVAELVAVNQTIAKGSWWRVRVWSGFDADTSTEPAAEFCAEANQALLRRNQDLKEVWATW